MPIRALCVPFLLLAAALGSEAGGLSPAPPQDKKADPPKKTADDPIAAQLTKDKEVYVAAVEKAKEVMLKAIDRHYEAVKNNKTLKIDVQLAQLEKIEAEKKAFEDADTSPTVPALKVAVSDYRAAQKKAEAQCKAAFEKAARAYRDKGDIKTAGVMLDEMKEFLARSPGATDPSIIVCGHSGKVLGPNRGAAEEGARVVTANPVKGDQAQLWRTLPAGDGWVHIEHVKTGLVVAVNGKGNGAEAHLTKKQADADGQLWKLKPVPNVKDAVKFVAKGTDRILAITSGSKDAGVRIILWDDNGDTSSGNFGFFPPPK